MPKKGQIGWRGSKIQKVEIWQYIFDWWERCWQGKFNLRKKNPKSDVYGSIKSYLRFNWIYGVFDCKKNWFLSQFQLLLDEIKVLASNYNFEKLILSNQGFNCIIIEVWWPIRDLIETIRNQGSNRKKTLESRDPIIIYPGVWLQDCKNIQGPNQKYHLKLENGAVSQRVVHCLLHQ